MRRKFAGALALTMLTAAGAMPVVAQTTGIREVTADPRSLVSLQSRLRYTTMIVLPEGEEILDLQVDVVRHLPVPAVFHP